MTPGRLRTLLVLLALLGSTLATVQFAASRAEAVPGLVKVSRSSSMSSNNSAVALAFCPGETMAYGGGAEVVTDSGTPGRVAVTAFKPGAALTSFGARANEVEDFTGTWHLVVTAYCAPPLPGLQVVFSNSDLSLATSQHVQARCPSGKVAIGGGGGVSASAGGNVLVGEWDGSASDYSVTATASVPVAQEWQVSAAVICVPFDESVRAIYEGSGLQSESPAALTSYTCRDGGQVHGAGGGAVGQDGNIVIDKIVGSAAGTEGTIRAYEKVPTAEYWQVFSRAYCAA
jgi:hypothetical protein